MLSKLIGLSPKHRRYERYVAIVCPFHDDHEPSLLAWDDGYFVCKGCNRQGSNKELLAKLEGREITGVETSTNRGLPLPTSLSEQGELCWRAHELLVKDNRLHRYLENRGVIGRVDKNDIGWWKGWYTVPITDQSRNFGGMVCRADPFTQRTKNLRFCMPTGQRPSPFYPNPEVMRETKKLYVVFGIFDALALSSLGYPVATSSGSKDTFEASWIDSRVEDIYIVPDEGEYMAADRLALDIGLKAKILYPDYPKGIKDPCGYLENNMEEALHEALAG